MSSAIHEQDVNDALAKEYAELYEKGAEDMAEGILYAADAIGRFSCVDRDIVREIADRDYMCDHPTKEIEVTGAGGFNCTNCGTRVSHDTILRRAIE